MSLTKEQEQAQKIREADAKKLVEVTIDVEGHIHNGEPVNKGAKIKVTESVKGWLIDQKIIKG